jgi:RimJ/RimL family protein N-acetyltransferase
VYHVAGHLLRKPEPFDVPQLYRIKNDPEIADLLVGFGTGYSRADLEAWIELHRTAADEVVFVIADREDQAIGHVGLYRIDHRLQSAEFAIAIGEPSAWGKGLGRACSRFLIGYGFDDLNLRRISLQVLEINDRALALYRSLGFVEEGRLRGASRWRDRWVDVIVMALMRDDALALVDGAVRTADDPTDVPTAHPAE